MRRAFTLVEVLVVIAIVGILAMVMFPFMNKARDNARRSSCQSNLKQIGLAFKQYCRDYDENYPLAYADLDGVAGYDSGVDKGWGEIVQPYLKSVEIFQCPSESNDAERPLMTSDYWLASPTAGTKDSEFSNQSLTVMFGDADQNSTALVATHGAIAYDGDAPTLKYNGEVWDITGATKGKGGRRHLEGLNFGFVDGHVKWLKPETVAADPVIMRKPTFRIK